VTLITIVRIAAVITLGLIGGVSLAYLRTKPAVDTLDASAFIRYQQHVHEAYKIMMPTLVSLGILTNLSWLISLWRHPISTEFILVALAAGALVTVLMITLMRNVPINDQLVTWDPAAPPRNLRQIWTKWEQASFHRGVLAIFAFVLVILAMQA